MNALNLSHHKEIAKEFKFIEDGKEVEVSEFPLDKKTTVIVGANNSRKSRFLRYLLKEKSYLFSEYNVRSLFDEMKNILNEEVKNRTSIGQLNNPKLKLSKDDLAIV